MKAPDTSHIGAKTREILLSADTEAKLEEAGIPLTGLSTAARGYSFTRNRPHFGQLLACLKGEGQVWVDNRWVFCRAGQAYLTPPEVFHSYHISQKGNWQLAWARFRTPLASSFEPTLLSVDPTGLASTIQALHRESVGLRSVTLMRQLADVLLFHIHRLARGKPGDERLLHLWAHVDAELQSPWTFDLLAAEAHISTEHLRRLCLQQYGKPPATLLRELRMRRASILLRQTTGSIEVVAEKVGYGDIFAFSKAFKRHFEISPLRYRQQAVNNRLVRL